MSILNVNQIQPVGGGNTITVSASDISASGATITATSFVGSVTGTTSNASGATGDFSIADKIVHTGDTDTAIRFPGADQVSIETGGTQRFLIGSDGKLVHSTSAAETVDFGTSNSSGSYHKYDLGSSGATVGYIGAGSQIVSGSNVADFGIRSQANLVFSSGGDTERLRITSDGKIGIGDVTPENTLTIKNIGSFEGDANSFYLGSNFTGTGQNYTGSNKHAQRFFFNNAASNGYLRYENTGTTGTAGNAITWRERFRITSSGQFLLGSATSASSDYKLESYSGGGYNIMARSTNGNGGFHNFTGQASNGTITSYITHNGRGYFEDGVQFDSSGEVLGTYEQGTFDPTITANSGGSITLNSGYNTLSYTKIGRIVHIGGQIRVSSVSSPVGNTNITNLPFTAQSTTEQGRAGSACFYYDASAGSGNYYRAVPIHVTEGTTTLKILNLHSFGGITVAANDELAFAFSYIAAS